MPWMSDERYLLFSDSREKKTIAASAHKQRTHCGKGGGVKFPSDYLTKKEIKAMSGECKTYRMSEPLSWEEFVEWPNEHKVTYITGIRDKFGASDKYIAEMFNVSCMMLGMWFKDLGMESKNDCNENWNKEKFYAWRSGANTDLVEEGPDLTKPMSWEEFKKLSDENKIIYIQGIRKQFNVPDIEIAYMLGVNKFNFGKVIRDLGIGCGKGSGGKRIWDRDAWARWAGSDKKNEEPVEEEPTTLRFDTEPEQGCTEYCCEKKRAIPKSGSMTYEGDIDDILNSIRLILEGSQVEITMSWIVKE